MSTLVANLSQLDSLAGYAGLFLYNEATSDTPDAAVPGTVTWKVATAAAGTFSAVGIAADSLTQARSNSPCATLISQSLALVGHVPGIGAYKWLRLNNAEEARDRSAYPGAEGTDYWSLSGSNFAVIKLATPVTTITPAPMALPSLLSFARSFLAIEADRHLSVHTKSGLSGDTLSWLDGSDALESGDSSKPLVFLLNGAPVVAAIVQTVNSGYMPGYYATQIAAIAASIGETVTFYGYGAGGASGLAPSLESSLSPCLAGAV